MSTRRFVLKLPAPSPLLLAVVFAVAGLLLASPAWAQSPSDTTASDTTASDTSASDTTASGQEENGPPPPPEDMPPSLDEYIPQSEAEAAAAAVLDEFGRMWETEDMDTFDRIVARDDSMIVIGTDAAEFIVGYEDFRKARVAQFESFENVEFNVESRTVDLSESGTTAWFTQKFDLYTVAEGEPVSLDGLRVSGVMEKRSDGQWQIVQLHTSVPVEGRAAEY